MSTNSTDTEKSDTPLARMCGDAAAYARDADRYLSRACRALDQIDSVVEGAYADDSYAGVVHLDGKPLRASLVRLRRQVALARYYLGEQRRFLTTEGPTCTAPESSYAAKVPS